MQWQTPDGYVSTLQGVIVHHHPVRSYWSEAFGTRQAAPPDCQSFDGLYGYGNPGGRCVDPATRAPVCPFAEFGTKPASSPRAASRAPACKNAYALYIVLPQNPMPVVFLAPGVSINPVRNYLRDMATQGFFARDVVTEFSLEQARNAEGILFSRAVLRAVGRTTETLQEALKACATTLRETLQAQAAFLQAYSPAALPSAAQTVEERQADVARVESSLAVPAGAGRLMFHDAAEDAEDAEDIADPPVPESVQQAAGRVV